MLMPILLPAQNRDLLCLFFFINLDYANTLYIYKAVGDTSSRIEITFQAPTSPSTFAYLNLLFSGPTPIDPSFLLPFPFPNLKKNPKYGIPNLTFES